MSAFAVADEKRTITVKEDSLVSTIGREWTTRSIEIVCVKESELNGNSLEMKPN